MWFFKKRTFIFILIICFTFLSCNKNSDKQNRIYLEDFLTWAPCTQNSLVEEIKGNKNAFTEFKKFDENTINEVKKTTMDFIWLKAEFKITNELKNKKQTMIIITHEIDFAMQVADKIIVMDQGRIIEEKVNYHE